jgi:hypothetical protein
MGANTQVNSGSTFDIASFFTTNSNVSYTQSSDILLSNPYDFLVNDFRPQAASPLISGADFTHPLLAVGIKDISDLLYLSLQPNPSNGVFSLNLGIRKTAEIKADLYDITGNKVKQLLDNSLLTAGNHRFTFNTVEIPAGIYFVRLSSSEGTKTLKVVLTK